MRKLFRFFKNIYLLDPRRAQEELRQRDEGYSIELVQEGPEQYIDYIEGDRKASITVEFSWMNDVVVFTDSFRSWSRPYEVELSYLDFLRVRQRVIQYLQCWGGDVRDDERQLRKTADLKKQLELEGIPYEDLGDGLIMYSNDIEEERKRGRIV